MRRWPMSEAFSPKSGWTTVAFGDVAKKVTDKVDPEESGLERYVAGEHMNTDDLRIRRWGEIGDDYLGPAFHMRFKPGQVLYGSRRTYLRKVALADFEGITANTTYVLESNDPEILLPELLPFLMQAETFHEHSKRESKGSVNPYVNFSDLAWYEFALPPLEEQRRIVEVLQAANSSIETLVNLKSDQDRCIEAGLKKIFSDLDAPVIAIGDVAHRVTNGFVGSAAKHYVDEGIPYLRSLNVRRTGVDLSDLIYVSEPFHEKTKKSQLAEGDLLTVQSGHVGETAVVPAECSDWNCHALIVTKLKREVAAPAYVSMYLNSLVGQRELARYYVGSTVLHLNTSDLARLEIPMPGIKEQIRISEYRSTAQRALKSIETRIERARLLQKTLLNEALVGCSEIK
jgi:type I restriction enzyme, S subunit